MGFKGGNYIDCQKKFRSKYKSRYRKEKWLRPLDPVTNYWIQENMTARAVIFHWIHPALPKVGVENTILVTNASSARAATFH